MAAGFALAGEQPIQFGHFWYYGYPWARLMERHSLSECDASETVKEALELLKIQWEIPTNKAGGSAAWRSLASSTMSRLRRDVNNPRPLRFNSSLTSVFMALHMMKQAARRFRSNSAGTWRGFAAMAMGLLGTPVAAVVTNLFRKHIPSEKAVESMEGAMQVLTSYFGVQVPPLTWGISDLDHMAVTRILNATSHWAVLGVSQSASQAQIRQGYFRLARFIHPDKCSVALAHDAFIRLHEAYEHLTN